MEQVDNIPRLIQVRDMSQDRILPLGTEVTDEVCRIVGIHILDDLRSDLLLRHQREDLPPSVLIHLGDHVRHLHVRQHPQCTGRILIRQVVDEGGDVRRVHRIEGPL